MPAANRRSPHSGTPRRTACGFAAAALLVLLAGCASVPKPLQGQFAAIDPAAAIAQDATGQAVRWGGTVAKVENDAGQTCFQLVARPLNEQSRPVLHNDRSGGRFLACRAGFYEPQVFAVGRSVTVTGHVTGYETRRVGEYDYRQPKVAADVIYLWPKVQRVRTVYAYDPFFGPPYPWGPWWW